MKTKIALIVAVLMTAARAQAALRVVATIPELVDIAQRVGGKLVEVQGLARGTEDVHQVVPKPSFVTKLNKADAVVYMGLSLEHAFLFPLLNVASNPKVRADPDTQGCTGPGCIDCSDNLTVLEKPTTLSRAQGELHPQGNPHYNIGPDDGVIIAQNIAAGLSRIDPSHREEYEKNLKAYLAELDAKLAEWRGWVKPLKGMKAVSYHKDVAYLGRFTGVDFIDTLEPKPGVAPTPTHLEQLVKEMKEQNVKLIVREQQYDAKMCEWLAGQTGAKVAVIGAMANALPGTDTFIKFSEKNLKNLLEAAGKGHS